MIRTVPRKQLRQLIGDDGRPFDVFPEQWAMLVRAAQAKAEGLELQYRLQRMEVALDALSSWKLNKEKYQAAFYLDRDAARILDLAESIGVENFRALAAGSKRTAPQLIEKVKADARAGKRLAGELTDKAKLLAEGLDWWYRGRYGSGTEYRGLAKSEVAMRSPNGLLWVNLPTAEPKPTRSAVGQAGFLGTQYSRRHNYVWAIDDVYRPQLVKISKDKDVKEQQLKSVAVVTGFC